MGAPGESRRRVTDFGYGPAWSPDGREIVLVTERLDLPTSRNSVSQLWAVRVDTGARRRVSEHDAMGPSWSPDGRRIAFWGLRGEGVQRDLWTVAADGSEVAAEAAASVVDDPAIDWAPVYSRDGRWLYFASTRGGTFNLWRAPLDAASGGPVGEPEPLTAPSSSAGPFALSADGRRLVFQDRNIDTEIMRAEVDLGRLALAAAPEPVFSGSFELREQKISPAGDWLVFTNEDWPQQLHLVRPDGTGYRQLTTGAERSRQGVWSPRGDWIVHQTSRPDSSLAAIRPDGSGWMTLPVGIGLATPIWSPDGSTIAAFDNGRSGVLIDVRPGLARAVITDLPPVAADVLFWPSAWSPDGALLAGRATRAGQIEDVVVREMSSGATRVLAGTRGAANDFSMIFVSPRHLVYNTVDTLWLRDVAGGESKRLYTAPSGRRVDTLAATLDGRSITWIERSDESDIWLMTLEEPAAR
jgi:Tol biopolymer transport system component